MKTKKVFKNNDKDHGSFENCSKLFPIIAAKISEFVGNAWVFIAMCLIVIIWLVAGPIFHFSDTWQLVIGTCTSVITFLIVFIIQNTQNRDTKAINIKLDELIRVHKSAHNSVIDLDKLSDKQLKELENHFSRISKKEDDDCSDVES